MRYTTDDQGILNNYAVEPGMYFSEYPTPEQQERYAFQGAIAQSARFANATLVVGLLLLTAFSVS